MDEYSHLFNEEQEDEQDERDYKNTDNTDNTEETDNCGECHNSHCGYNPSFGKLCDTVEDGDILAHYDHNSTGNLIERVKDPFGVYAIQNICGYSGQPEEETFPGCKLSEDFSEEELQDACDKMCDCMHWPHLPVSITCFTPNAGFYPGLFTRCTFDDSLKLNPEYAKSCIEHVGGTDIVMSDMAHEIGHSIATKICGNMGTYMDEKVADFISGFINGKMGIDIDSARRWFEWYYDPEGQGGYPISEERWDAEAAGYYFSHLANGIDLQNALKDDEFLKIIEAYTHDKADVISEMMWQSTNVEHCAETNSTFFDKFLKSIKDNKNAYAAMAYRYIKGLHF